MANLHSLSYPNYPRVFPATGTEKLKSPCDSAVVIWIGLMRGFLAKFAPVIWIFISAGIQHFSVAVCPCFVRRFQAGVPCLVRIRDVKR